jgi:hypothetical protein
MEINDSVDAALNPSYCGKCGELIQESPTTLPVDRKPCPKCGSLARTLSDDVHESLTIREKIGMKHKRPGHKKPIYESVSGDDLYRVTGQWSKLTREIDRQNDRYKELIVDPKSGKVIRHCDEPLSVHTGRGSAKPKPTEGNHDA